MRLSYNTSKSFAQRQTTIGYGKSAISEENFRLYVKKIARQKGSQSSNNNQVQALSQPRNVKHKMRILPSKQPVIVFNAEMATEQIHEMRSSITKSGMRVLLWYFNKTMRRLVRGLLIDMQSV